MPGVRLAKSELMLPRAFFDQPLGPRFSVRSARDLIAFDAPGWIVTHRQTGLAIWTGCSLTMAQAADRLDEHIRLNT